MNDARVTKQRSVTEKTALLTTNVTQFNDLRATNNQLQDMGGAVDAPSPAEINTYKDLMFKATEQQIERLHGLQANTYQALYEQAKAVGLKLRVWREQQELGRSEAAEQLNGWSRATVTLMEQGLLLLDECETTMLESLRRIGVLPRVARFLLIQITIRIAPVPRSSGNRIIDNARHVRALLLYGVAKPNCTKQSSSKR